MEPKPKMAKSTSERTNTRSKAKLSLPKKKGETNQKENDANLVKSLVMMSSTVDLNETNDFKEPMKGAMLQTFIEPRTRQVKSKSRSSKSVQDESSNSVKTSANKNVAKGPRSSRGKAVSVDQVSADKQEVDVGGATRVLADKQEVDVGDATRVSADKQEVDVGGADKQEVHVGGSTSRLSEPSRIVKTTDKSSLSKGLRSTAEKVVSVNQLSADEQEVDIGSSVTLVSADKPEVDVGGATCPSCGLSVEEDFGAHVKLCLRKQFNAPSKPSRGSDKTADCRGTRSGADGQETRVGADVQTSLGDTGLYTEFVNVLLLTSLAGEKQFVSAYPIPP
jgi:hypothetical protein